MRRIDLFCPSAASTEICLSTRDESCGGGGGRAIDRHNPHLRDNRRRSNTTTTAADPSSSSSSKSQPHKKNSKSKNKSKISFCANRCDRTISPSGSSRYLLSDDASSTTLVDHEFAPLPTQPSKSCIPHPNSSSLLSTPTTPPPPATNHDHQVVALRVSLHCRGCEGKVRKHLSKMKGVTSFNIDFGMKKVTVIGDVTPVGVLASISRVKNAQFWPSLSSSSSIYSTQRISKSII